MRGGYNSTPRGRRVPNSGHTGGYSFHPRTPPAFTSIPPPASFKSTHPPCQICNDDDHLSPECTNRFNFAYQGKQPPANLHAMLAAANIFGENLWYADNGANQHISATAVPVEDYNNYDGYDSIQTTNGEGMSISVVGNSLIHTPSRKFQLQHILHVPQASTNLLSVHRFTTDNNCTITFSSVGYTVRDLHTGEILLQDPHNNGLYPINFKKPIHALHGKSVSSTIWHHRLAHPFLKFYKKSVINCLSIMLSSHLFFVGVVS